MHELIKVLAQLELFAGENMLQTPIFNRYRPAFDFPGAGTKISGSIDLINKDHFVPGTSGVVEITFMKGMISDDYLKKGENFTISEGGKYNLGKGVILKVNGN